MILRALLVASLLLSVSMPAAAAERTAFLLQQLDQCDPTHPETYAPKLDVLLALADGRSALELATLLGQRRDCTGYVTWHGEGADELVFVGAINTAGVGALLWVDSGWWRAAAVPTGYITGTSDVQKFGAAREFFLPYGSGGSAGSIGVTGIRLFGATATVTMRLMPGAELRRARLLDDDHVLIEGRLTNDPLFTWMSHPAWPYGAQWIFERRGGVWVASAHRQSRDPAWLMTGFVGALLTRDTATMRRFATDAAIAEALDLPALDRRIDGLRLLADRDFTSDEQMSWEALPPQFRTRSVDGPVYGYFTNYDVHTRSILEVAMRFDRVADGWTITAVERIARPGPQEQGLVP